MTMKVDFWSSIEYAAYMRELAAVLEPHGIRLRPRFQVPQTAYWSTHRGTAGRLLLRLRMYAVYPLQVAFDFLFRREPVVAIVCTTTFYAPWIAVRCAGRRRKVVNLLYDLYPESIIASGMLRPDSAGARLLRRMATDTLRRAAASVQLGDRLAAYTLAAFPGTDPARLHTIPFGSVEAPFATCDPQPRPAGRVPVILYCGNLGHVHDTETVIAYLSGVLRAPSGSAPVVAWRFHATGAGYGQLTAALRPFIEIAPAAGPGRSSVALAGNLPDGAWEVAMQDADVALVTMRPGAERVLMPSKTYSALAAGQAILAVCPRDSDLADLVIRHDCGWVVEPGNSAGLAAAVQELADRPAELLRRRRNARQAGTAHYGLSVVARQWAYLLHHLDRPTV